MPVKLIPTKRKWINVEDASFEVEFITPARLSEYYNRFTDKGKLDIVAVVEAVLKEYVKNWKNVVDEDGQEVQFSKELISHLPLQIQNELFNEIARHATETAEEVEKNS